MCYNEKISLNTFLFGMISLIILLLFNYINKKEIIKFKYLIIIVSITSIQLLEYFAWKNINNKNIIRNLSIIGLIIIGIQIILMNSLLLEGKIRKISLIILIILIILFIILQVPNINFDMKKGENLHLIWYWFDLPLIWIILIIIFYLIPAFFNKNKDKYKRIPIIVVIFLSLSLYYYYKYKTWGTMWCYFSNLIWIYYLLKIIMIKIMN